MKFHPFVDSCKFFNNHILLWKVIFVAFRMPNIFIYLSISPIAQQTPVGQGLLIIEASRSYPHTPNSIIFLRTSDRPWQHTAFTRDKHPCPPQFQEWAAADPRLRLLFHERQCRSLLPFPTIGLHPATWYKTAAASRGETLGPVFPRVTL